MSAYSKIPERNLKAKVAGMVVEYLIARDFYEPEYYDDDER